MHVSGTPHRIFPLVHISKLNRVKIFSDRPRNQPNVEEADRLDFDEPVQMEEIRERTLDEDEFEIEKIMDVRSLEKIRFGRIQHQYLVQW